MLKNVVAERAFEQSPAHCVAHRELSGPHAEFGALPAERGRELPVPGPRLVPIERQLSQLQRRSRDVLGHRLILDPAARALRELGATLLANIRRIQFIRRKATIAGEPGENSVPLIQEIIQSSHGLLDVIVDQIALCGSTMHETLAVADWGRRLTLQQPLKLYKLLPLFDRSCEEIRRVPELHKLIPISGLPLASIVESLSGQADAANFVQGVTTARVLVWVLGDDQCQKHSLARLVLAALLQDVGRLPVIPGGLSIRVLRTQRPEWLEQQHPAIGAALFGSVRGVPIELPMLVAQHHEQLGGGGFPCALAARNILPESAILAAASRFAELCLTLPAATVPGANLAGGCSLAQVGKSMLAPAAEALVAEAEWGKWSLTFCNRIMDRVAEAEAIKHRQHLEEPGEGSTADDRVLHLHDQETSLHGTHLNPMPRPAGPILRDAQSLIQDD